MPIKELVALATAFVMGMAAAHPRDYRMRLAKIQYAMLREVGNTRSWGNPSIFQYNPRQIPEKSHSHRRPLQENK